MIHTFGLGKGVLGGGGTPDSRFPEKIWSTAGLQTPDSRFPEKIWSTSRGVPRTPDSRFPGNLDLESGARVLQIFSGNLESGVRGPGTPDFFWESGVWSPGPRYSRIFLEIWSLESGARVLQIFSGNLESGVRGWVLQIFSGSLVFRV